VKILQIETVALLALAPWAVKEQLLFLPKYPISVVKYCPFCICVSEKNGTNSNRGCTYLGSLGSQILNKIFVFLPKCPINLV
jgi:hypothetical protein